VTTSDPRTVPLSDPVPGGATVNDTAKQQLVERLQAGKRAARERRPSRLLEVEAAMAELEEERRALPPEERGAIYPRMRELGRQWSRLAWPGGEREAA
jgi:hypothetical protein